MAAAQITPADATARTWRRLPVALADSLWLGAAVLAVELLVVAAWAHGELAHPYEVGRLLLTLLPLGWAAQLPVAIGGAVLLWGLAAADRPQLTRAAVAVPAVALTAAVAAGISTGRHFTGSKRALFIGAATAVVAVAAWLLGPPLARGLRALAQRGAGVLPAVVAAAAAGLELVNALVLPRLYPAFHQGLAVLTLWTAALAGLGWSDWHAPPAARRQAVRRRGLAALILLLTATAIAYPAAQRLRLYDNVRLIYLERAPLLGHVVRLAAVLAPPPALGDDDSWPGVMPRPERSVDLRGRDIVLLSVDALRADHVGAYGYERRLTPTFDRLAAEGVVFEAAYTATPHTSYAITSLMTGKHLRPLLLQGVGQGSLLWAELLQRYGYRTAAFYPPAIFFVDTELFTSFRQNGLGFEYRKVEFAGAQGRAEQVRAYLQQQPAEQRLFLWVHMFEPHEPYEKHPEHDFGDRAVDRYDSEIAAADAGLGRIVELIRAQRPRALIILTSDHGEEHGDHGGSYHGMTVYDEQVRVPLIFHAPGLLLPRRVSEPVSLIDLLPTVATGLDIPLSPRVRGRDLGHLLSGGPEQDEGYAFAETEEQTLWAQRSLRLICTRSIGACRLYDVATDPAERRDVSAAKAETLSNMKRASHRFMASLGRFELGSGPAGRGASWPPALRRGIAGEAEAALDVAVLLDDADVAIRRKAAEVLFELKHSDSAPHLRRALRQDEDDDVRRFCALALTRLGQGAPLTFDLLESSDQRWRRLAALALAEAGDGRGERVLVEWWQQAFPEAGGPPAEPLSFERSRQLVAALASIRSELAVLPLTRALKDVRLRSLVARALAQIGEPMARPALAAAFTTERYLDARLALAEALVTLGASGELRDPLVRFLGVPDPLPSGLDLAMRADLLPFIGGPSEGELRRLASYAKSGIAVGMVIPEGGNGRGLRVIARAQSTDAEIGEVRFGLLQGVFAGDRRQLVPERAPRLDPALSVKLEFPPGLGFHERYAMLPAAAASQITLGDYAEFVVYVTQNVEIRGCAVVPLADEIPPPPPKPWSPPE